MGTQESDSQLWLPEEHLKNNGAGVLPQTCVYPGRAQVSVFLKIYPGGFNLLPDLRTTAQEVKWLLEGDRG